MKRTSLVAHQLGLLGGLDGTQLAWMDPAWLEAAADELEHAACDGEDLRSESDELVAELQESLAFDGERPKYEFPSLEHLHDLDGCGHRIYCEHPPAQDHVAQMSTEDLAERLEWLHFHRARGLSPLDLAVQREWTARSLSMAFFYGRAQPQLPQQLVELATPRAPQQRVVLAAVCISLVRGAMGLTISAPDAWTLWRIPGSTWWKAIAALEKRGLITRMHRYRYNERRGEAEAVSGAPVLWCQNWIGPGPELMRRLETVLAAFGSGTEDELAASHALLISQRAANARERRRRERGESDVGAPAPAWAIALGHVLHDAACADAASAEAAARWAVLSREGPGELGELLGRDPPPRAPDPDEVARVEDLAELGDLGPSVLRDAALELGASSRSPAPSSDERKALERRMIVLGLRVGDLRWEALERLLVELRERGRAGPARAARRASFNAVHSVDAAPEGLGSRQEERRDAGPFRAAAPPAASNGDKSVTAIDVSPPATAVLGTTDLDRETAAPAVAAGALRRGRSPEASSRSSPASSAEASPAACSSSSSSTSSPFDVLLRRAFERGAAAWGFPLPEDNA